MILSRVSKYLSILTILIGSLVCIGWILDLQVIKSISPEFPSMKMNTALSLVLLGVTLLQFSRVEENRTVSKINRFLTMDLFPALVALVGAATILQYLLGRNLGIDQIIINDSGIQTANSQPGRMSLITAINFLLLGMSFIFFRLFLNLEWLWQTLVLICIYFTSVVLLGYLIEPSLLFKSLPFYPAPLHTGLCQMMLGLGLLLLRPKSILMSTFINAIVSKERFKFSQFTLSLIPILLAVSIQLIFWSIFQPYAYLLLYPAVFLSSWVGGVLSGIITAIIAAACAWYFFIFPEQNLVKLNPNHLFVMVVFLGTGVLFSIFHELLKKATRKAATALTLSQYANSDLEQSNKKLRIFEALIENSSDFVGIADANGRPMYVNPAGRRMVGLAADQPIENTQIPEYYPPEERAFASDVIVKSMVEKGYWKGETAFRHWQSQKAIPVSDTHFIINDPKTKEVLGMGTVTRDISDIKQASERLRKSEQRYIELIEHASDGIFFADTDGLITDSNKLLCNMLGYSKKELIGKNIYDLVPPEEKLRLVTVKKFMTDPGQTHIGEWKFKKKNGSYLEIEKSGKIYSDQRWIGFIRDISVRKQIEHEREVAILKYRDLFEGAYDSILVVDSQGQIQLVNKQVEKTFGYESNELIGQQLEILIPERYRGGHMRSRDTYLATPHARPMGVGLDLFARKKDGSEFPVDISLSPLKTGSDVQVTAIIRDISERKNVERSLAEQSRELARSNAELEQFAYVTSHDLREPLRMVTNYAGLLQRRYKGRLDDSADKSIRYIVDGVSRMQHLISDMLTYSRVGKADSSFEVIDMNGVTKDATKGLEAAIRESKALLTIESLPVLLSNRLLMQQLMQNLLSNAIKFHKKNIPPQVRVSASHRNKEWIFSVSDNGIGIESQYADRIFVIFQRLHSNTEYTGTGIGLAICKKIIDREGGKIWMESRPGEGTTFYFSIPEKVSSMPNDFVGHGLSPFKGI